jgi:hypothetical protein
VYKIKAYKIREGFANINQPNIKRSWMDNTWEAHAYHCFPVSLGNQLGWTLSFPEDIVFIWDGINDSSPDHVKILKGEKYAYAGRANATISFHTGIAFRTEEDLSLAHLPVPNNFIDGAQAFTTLMSTSFYDGEFPCAWMITRPNIEITIKANTPIVSIVPINLKELNNSEIQFESISLMKTNSIDMNEYSNEIYKLNREGVWADFYRKSVDHKGNKIGEHQVKSIKLHIK